MSFDGSMSLIERWNVGDWEPWWREQLPNGKRHGSEYVAVCPFHEDHKPSLSANIKTTAWKCHSCEASGNAITFVTRRDGIAAMDAARKIKRYHGIPDIYDEKPARRPEPSARPASSSYDVAAYAAEKGLDAAKLAEWGLTASRGAVLIPYRPGDAIRKRHKPGSDKRFSWATEKGDDGTPRMIGETCLYGVWRLPEWREQGAEALVLVEGESDCHALWSLGIPALGVPGASSFRREWADLLAGFALLIHDEGDSGAQTFIARTCEQLTGAGFEGRVSTWATPGAKDPAEIFARDGADALAALQTAIDAAEPVDLFRGASLDGAALLEELHEALGKYVVWPSPQAHDAVTVWVAATHAQSAWEHAPRLVLCSPEKRSGKTRGLELIDCLAYHVIPTVNASVAAIVRCIDAEDPPTLSIDEADTVFGSKKAAESNEDLRGILNAGFGRGKPYLRYNMKARELEHCPTFSMAALASIGDLPDTIMDRAVVARMRRRDPDHEKVAPFRTRRNGVPLEELRERVHTWARAHLRELTDAVPDMPVEDRAADVWEPLVAIADLAAGPWPTRVRAACTALVADAETTATEVSLGVRMLADVREAFRSDSFLSSKELTDRLTRIEESPWAEFGLSMNKVARRLARFGIRPCKDYTKTIRGYRRTDFDDAWARYLSGDSCGDSSTTGKCPQETAGQMVLGTVGTDGDGREGEDPTLEGLPF